jgi:radical SAM enzyme (TIGR01210 family)
LGYAIRRLSRTLPNLTVLGLETRPEYVSDQKIEFLTRVLFDVRSPIRLEIAVGFEAFDERIRNEVYCKGLSLEAFEDFAHVAARFGFRLKCYFMQKPVPGMTDQEAVADIRHGIDYLSSIAAKHGVEINVHVNPTYVSAGTAIEHAFHERRYTPPRLRDVARAAGYARNRPLSVFIGLSDEGRAVEGGSFLRDGDGVLVKQLEAFNRTQDFGILDVVSAGAE